MVGEVIQKKRKEAGFTQAQLAEMLGVTPPAVNRWEKNLSFPDATLLAPLARLLKTDINTLFSFYDTLSEAERDAAVNEARNKLLIRLCLKMLLSAEKQKKRRMLPMRRRMCFMRYVKSMAK